MENYTKEKKSKRARCISLLNDITDMTILDIGSTDGYISQILLDRGALSSDAFDYQTDPLKDNRINYTDYKITSWTDFIKNNNIKKSYDIVLVLAVIHHFEEKYREVIFKNLLKKTDKYFCFRSTKPTFNQFMNLIPDNFERVDKFIWRVK